MRSSTDGIGFHGGLQYLESNTCYWARAGSPEYPVKLGMSVRKYWYFLDTVR